MCYCGEIIMFYYLKYFYFFMNFKGYVFKKIYVGEDV